MVHNRWNSAHFNFWNVGTVVKGWSDLLIGAELHTTADQALLFYATDCEWCEGVGRWGGVGGCGLPVD